MGIFDDLLKTASTEDQAVFNKYPALKTSMEKLEGENSQLGRFAGQWNGWANGYTDERGVFHEGNWDADSGMTKAEKALRDELAAANASATAGAGANAAELVKLRQELADQVKAMKAETEQSFQGQQRFWTSAGPLMLKHQQEFGEVLNPQSLFEFIQKGGYNDPDLAYQQMVAGRRSEVAAQKAKELEEKHAADITAAEQRGREAAAREVAMGPNGVLPTDSTGGIAGVTSQIAAPAKVSDEEKARIAESKLGDGSMATLGYQKFLRGDFSQAQ